MDSATEDIYLQRLEEFVYDEEKIVTARWLCIKLDINIKDSKHLLEKYVGDVQDTKGKTVSLTYILSGTTSDGLYITIANENELEEKKAIFTEVPNQQIYSVSKLKEIELNVLNMVDHFDINNPKANPISGSIRSKMCVERKFKPSKPLPITTQKPTVHSKSSFFTKLPAKSDTSNSMKNSKSVNNVATTDSTGSVTESKASTTVSSNVDTNSSIKGSETNNKSKQSNGIKSFFGKATTSSNVKSIPTKLDVKPEPVFDKISTEDRISNLVDSESDSEETVVKSENVSKKKETPKTKSTKKRTKKNNSKAPSPKRRKRIVQADSDSDDMFGSDSKEDVNEPVLHSSDEETPQPQTNRPLAPKNKKRKLVDRTYTDEDGYIITNKEWVEESPSEDEIIPETPQKEPKKLEIKTETKPDTENKQLKKSESSDLSDTNNKDTKGVNGKAKGPKAKGKKTLAANQPTLMNFFKKI